MFARLSLALAGSTLLLATPALAQAEPTSVTVSATDLDLASAAGRAHLGRRISRAANEICDNRMGGTTGRELYLSCRSDTLAAADREVARLVQLKSGQIQLARNAR